MNINKSILISVLLFIAFGIFAQNREELEEKRAQIIKQMEITNSILAETKSSKKATLDQYRNLENQIQNRNALIGNIQMEIEATGEDINSNRNKLSLLNRDIEHLQNEYTILLRAALRQKLTRNYFLYLLSSSSLKEALLKMRYTKQFEKYAKQKAKLIVQNQFTLKSTIGEIEEKRKQQEELLEQEKAQNDLVEYELGKKDRLLSALEKDEKRLISELQKQEFAGEKLNEAISEIINKETITKETGAANNTNTLDEERLAVNFNNSKGQMNWPVSKGFISIKFGKQKHPTLKNIQISNNGVEIRTELGAEVFSIFDGVVSGRASIPGYHNMLVIKHGVYRTVYARLSEIYVRKGELVEKGQIIGKLAIEENKSELHFEIWNNEKKINPESWLISK